MTGETKSQGVGRSVRRKEDDRYMRGMGEFVGDIKLSGMQELAFVRSPLAHARILNIRKPAGQENRVFVAADLIGIKPIVANSGLPGFKPSAQPILAYDKVRHVGEAIAVCVAATRAEAEDLAAAVEVDFEELPAVVDMLAARAPGAPLVHEHWGDNVFLESRVEADLSEIKRTAPVVVRRTLRTARQCMSPLEGRGVVAVYDRRLDQIVLYTSTQIPHIIRTGLAGCLGLSEENVQIVAPDVGGGFGYEGMLLSEEVCAAFLARHLGHPLRWLEDRREQLAGNANCREHYYDITAYADEDGRLIALDAAATVDTGAYSIYPFSACLEAAQVASILPGPYKFDAYRCVTWSSATNKPGLVPYRGVARAGVCYAMETMIDAIAHAVDKEPYEVPATQPRATGRDAVQQHHQQAF